MRSLVAFLEIMQLALIRHLLRMSNLPRGHLFCNNVAI